MSRRISMFRITIVLAALLAPWLASAQDAPASAASAAAPAHDAHAAMPEKSAQGMTMPMHDSHAGDASSSSTASKPSMSSMATMPSMPQTGSTSPRTSMDMGSMDMRSMQGGRPPPGARSPDYSDGISFPPDRDAHMHGDARVGMLGIDQLEYVHTPDGDSGALEGQAWYGGDLDRATLKFEGEASGGRVTDARVEAMWTHAVSAFWDTQLGVRHDDGEGPTRDWAAFGVQGLAPYWFDVQATVYAGAAGRTAARFEAEYEVLFTERLILTPKFELNAYGKDDPARGIGRGVSDATLGVRLRYEIRRRFAPYIGVQWTRRFGATAGLARDRNEPAFVQAWVAGVRIWL